MMSSRKGYFRALYYSIGIVLVSAGYWFAPLLREIFLNDHSATEGTGQIIIYLFIVLLTLPTALFSLLAFWGLYRIKKGRNVSYPHILVWLSGLYFFAYLLPALYDLFTDFSYLGYLGNIIWGA